MSKYKIEVRCFADGKEVELMETEEADQPELCVADAIGMFAEALAHTIDSKRNAAKVLST